MRKDSNDNKVVDVGIAGSNLIVTRYNADGSLDTSFGSSGTVSISESSPNFASVALQSDGKLVVDVDSGSNVLVYRLNADGSLDTGFGSSGVATVAFSGAQFPMALAIQSDGKVVLADTSPTSTGTSMARLTSSGSLDTTFGTGGKVDEPLSGAPSATSLALQANGKIVVAGGDGSGNFAVLRFNSDGSLDTAFGSSGEATTNFGGADYGYSVALGPGGTIVVGGYSHQSGYDYALARFTSTGSLDSTFGSSGKVLGAANSGVIRGILVEPDGSILAGGDGGVLSDQALWKFTPSGSADTTFASGGVLTANTGVGVGAWAVAKGSTERVVLAGNKSGDLAMSAFCPKSLRLYAQHDANYNVTALTNASGAVVERYVYDPYGAVTVLNPDGTTRGDGRIASSQYGVVNLFQGMRFDSVTGLYETPNRELNPGTGTWMQADPAGYVNGPDRYQAEGSLPTARLDPTGLNSVEDWRRNHPEHRQSDGPEMRPYDPSIEPPMAWQYFNIARQGVVDAFMKNGAPGTGLLGAGLDACHVDWRHWYLAPGVDRDAFDRSSGKVGQGINGTVGILAGAGIMNLAAVPGAIAESTAGAASDFSLGANVETNFGGATQGVGSYLGGGGLMPGPGLSAGGGAPEAQAALMNGGKPFDLALGLSEHQTIAGGPLLQNFARHVNGSTYFDIFGDGPATYPELESNIMSLMSRANTIHVNLDGLCTDNISDLARLGSQGIDAYPRFPAVYGDPLPGNITNWEIYKIESDPALRLRALYYRG